MLLLYCMAEADPQAEMPTRGVRGAAVESVTRGNIVCYFSRYEHFSGGSADALKQDALDFHWANIHIFRQQTIIPFRFPALVPDESAVHLFLEEHYKDYLADLRKLRPFVQMEVRVKAAMEIPPFSTFTTGTAFLQGKRDAKHAAQKRLEETSAALAAAYPTAQWAHRRERYFALIQRSDEQAFRDAIEKIEGLALRVSGPWPPSEFVNCYPDVSENKA